MNVGSLFTGCGGLDLGLPGHTVWMCESDKHARRVLTERSPGVPVYPDVRELGADTPRVDMLVGGYPCQPFSQAGKRGGDTDPRHLWPEFARLIRLLRPRYALLENVSGHLGLGFDAVLCDLADAGFDAEWVVVRASQVGAPHRRERLFCLATDANGERVRAGHRDAAGSRGTGEGEGPERQWVWSDDRERGGAATDSERERLNGGGRPDEGSEAGRRDDGRPEPAGHPLLVTDADLPGPQGSESAEGRHLPDWGAYEPAIRRWEHLLGRPAPRPTDDRGRLMPAFVTWMMGLPDGWVNVEDVSRTQQLRVLGNACVPQQVSLAWQILASDIRPAASAPGTPHADPGGRA